MAPSCPRPLGKLLPGWGGGKLLFKSASISSSSLPAEQGDGEPRPDAIPFRSRPGNWPSCSCLRPGALDTGPSHCAGEGGEKENSDAHGPLPHPAALSAHPRPPHSHPSRAPEPLRLNFSSTLPGAARKPAPRLEPPRREGAAPPRAGRCRRGEGRSRWTEPGVTGEGVRVAAARGGRGRRPAARRSGTQGHWGVGGRLPAPGEGPVPRQGSSPKAVLWDNSGSPEEPRGRGGVEARRSRGLEAGAWGAGAPTGQGAGPRVPGGK